MNNQLNCEIIRDLLPSYADGLTSDTTSRAVQAHLSDCAECTEILALMREPAAPQAPEAEVDYLRKVRRRGSRARMFWGIAMLLVGMLLIFARVFLIGSEAGAQDASLQASVEGGRVYISGSLASTTAGVARVAFEESAGMVNLRLYTAPKSFFNSREVFEVYTPHNDTVSQIRCGGQIIWENGVQITPTVAKLYASAHPFVGDMSANDSLAAILGISNQFGPYTNALQTETEPYGWTFRLEADIAADEHSAARDIMTADAYILLSAVENLGSVTWDYRTEGKAQTFTVTAADASAYVGSDIKLCAQSASALQALYERLSIKWAGVGEVLQQTGSFDVKISNYADAALYELTMTYYLSDKLIGTRSVRSADNAALGKGEELSFTFTPEDFPAGSSAISLSGFRFDLSAADEAGNPVSICENTQISAKYAWSYYFSLTGKDTLTLTPG